MLLAYRIASLYEYISVSSFKFVWQCIKGTVSNEQ